MNSRKIYVSSKIILCVKQNKISNDFKDLEEINSILKQKKIFIFLVYIAIRLKVLFISLLLNGNNKCFTKNYTWMWLLSRCDIVRGVDYEPIITLNFCLVTFVVHMQGNADCYSDHRGNRQNSTNHSSGNASFRVVTKVKTKAYT